MRKILIIFTVLVLFAPSFVLADAISFRVGYFFPSAGSDLWDIEFENMDFSKSNYIGSSFSFAYEYFLSRQLSLMLCVDGYNRQKVGAYMDFVGYQDFDGDWAYPNDFEGDYVPTHVFSVSNTPIQISLKFTPTGRRGKIIPYVGGGAGLYVWSVKLQGDIVDFSDPWIDTDFDVEIYPIYSVDAREDSKFSIGFHAFGGLMFPIANRISVEGEFKYNFVTANWSEDLYFGFQGFESFDLSGFQISVGINYWF